MASFSIKIVKLPKSETARGWLWVVVVGTLLTVISLFDRGGIRLADGSTGCQVRVSADVLNVRSAANPTAPVVGKLSRDEQVDGTKVVTNGFRQLADGNWVASVNVTPVAGTVCS